jgi:hypothetical protein
MASRASRLIMQLYGKGEQKPPPRALVPVRPSRSRQILVRYETQLRARQLAKQRRWRFFLVASYLLFCSVALVVAVLLFVGVYYFNFITSLDQNVAMGLSRIESLLNRRHNLSTNLAIMVRDYASHEERVLLAASLVRAQGELSQPSTEATNGLVDDSSKKVHEALRGGLGGAKDEAAGGRAVVGKTRPATPLQQLLASFGAQLGAGEAGTSGLNRAGLLAVAEQYPTLLLNQNFLRFMDAIIDTEKAIAEERMNYSTAVNAYTTAIKTVPGRWYARLFGFGDMDYLVTPPEVQAFRPVAY